MLNQAPHHEDAWGGGGRSALDRDECSASRSGRFIPGEGTPSTHCIGDRLGHRTGLDVVAKRKFPASAGN